VPGLVRASCESTNTVRVTLSSSAQTYGPRSALLRRAWRITQGETKHTVGRPELSEDRLVALLPIGGRWLRGANVAVHVFADDSLGQPYLDPATVECLPLVEQDDEEGLEPLRPPRDDFATDRETGGLTTAGGSYRHHWGEEQLKKVVERWLLSQPPFGIGLQLGVPLTPSEVSRLEVGVRRMLLEQSDILDALVHFLPRRRADVLVVQIGIQTPDGWRDFTLPIGEP